MSAVGDTSNIAGSASAASAADGTVATNSDLVEMDASGVEQSAFSVAKPEASSASQCARLDLFNSSRFEGLAENRKRVLSLQHYSSLDHAFEQLRRDDKRNSHLKSQPLMVDNESRVFRCPSLLEILQAPEEPLSRHAADVDESGLLSLVEQACHSSSIPKSISRRNAILKDEKEAWLKEKLAAQQRQLEQQRLLQQKKEFRKQQKQQRGALFGTINVSKSRASDTTPSVASSRSFSTLKASSLLPK